MKSVIDKTNNLVLFFLFFKFICNFKGKNNSCKTFIKFFNCKFASSDCGVIQICMTIFYPFKHNKMVERTYNLETRVSVLEQKGA